MRENKVRKLQQLIGLFCWKLTNKRQAIQWRKGEEEDRGMVGVVELKAIGMNEEIRK